MLKKLLVAAAVSAAIAACSSTKEPEPAPEPTPVASAPVIASAPVASAPVVSNHNSVYFGFDQYDIKEGYTGIVKANADHLVATPDAKIQVQGNTDAVGSVEYNLSLGQRRADAVKKALIADGASKKQIEAISNGKLKLLVDTKDREPKNRRSDITYKSGQPTGYSQDSSGLPMVDESVYSGTVPEGIE
jgi:peptidoglycan-associated lipoprotein